MFPPFCFVRRAFSLISFLVQGEIRMLWMRSYLFLFFEVEGRGGEGGEEGEMNGEREGKLCTDDRG
jgi:hypothetical protein